MTIQKFIIKKYYKPAMKRLICTMTPDEFRQMIGHPNFDDAFCLQKIMQMSKSLYHFHRVLGNYSTFDSLTWLIENDFDLNFTEARKDGDNPL